MQVESALLFETPSEIFGRVFAHLQPRQARPRFQVEFRPFANANSSISLQHGVARVHITDLLREAPAPVIEALAYLLLSKMLSRRVPDHYRELYRLFLNRADVRGELQRLRRSRGRKHVSEARGQRFDLDALFDRLNAEHFGGTLARPRLGWSHRVSRTRLGHYDASHQTIVLSRLLDGPNVHPQVVEFVLFHEMLHLKFPVRHEGARRCIHGPEFRAAEREFPHYEQVKRLLTEMLAQ